MILEGFLFVTSAALFADGIASLVCRPSASPPPPQRPMFFLHPDVIYGNEFESYGVSGGIQYVSHEPRVYHDPHGIHGRVIEHGREVQPLVSRLQRLEIETHVPRGRRRQFQDVSDETGFSNRNCDHRTSGYGHYRGI